MYVQDDVLNDLLVGQYEAIIFDRKIIS